MLSNSFNIEAWVGQECILTPILFKIYNKYITRLIVIIDMEEGIRTGGRKMRNMPTTPLF